MQVQVFQGILIPFLGTALGSACVLFMKNKLNLLVQRALTGFAAGVMIAASIWILLIPAMEQSAAMGKWHLCLQWWVSGLVFCSCCFWTGRFLICT